MHVYVEYKVPVLVEVDLDQEAIVGVYVDDEQVEGPYDVIGIDPDGLAAAEAFRAVELAESESWPAWEFSLSLPLLPLGAPPSDYLNPVVPLPRELRELHYQPCR